jgi:hypothetical protein
MKGHLTAKSAKGAKKKQWKRQFKHYAPLAADFGPQVAQGRTRGHGRFLYRHKTIGGQ